MEKQNQLMVVIQESNVEPQTAQSLKDSFLPFFDQAEEWKKKAEGLVVTDVSQIREMKIAREARLALKEIRVQADKKRKELKEDSIRYGKAVQGVYNVIEFLIAPIEKHLELQEKFVEIQDAKKKAELKLKRETILQPFMEFVAYGLDFGIMSEEDFQKILNGAKLQLQAKIDAEKKAEYERKEQERRAKLYAERKNLLIPYWRFLNGDQVSTDFGEIPEESFKIILNEVRQKYESHEMAQKKIREEAERLKKERERREEEIKRLEKLQAEKLRKEREEIEKERKEQAEKLAKAKAEKERAEKELRLKKEAEEKLIRQAEQKRLADERERKEAERKAQMAPDKEKMIKLANDLIHYKLPDLKTKEAKELLSVFENKFKHIVEDFIFSCNKL